MVALVSTGVCASFQIPNRNHAARRAPMPAGRLRMPVGRFESLAVASHPLQREQPSFPGRARRSRSRSATNLKIHGSSASLERHQPVRFPRPAVITRERLLEVAGVRRDLRELVAHENLPAIELLQVNELAVTVLELAHDGHTDGAVATVRPADRPLLGFRIVKTQSDALEMTSRTVELEVSDACTPVPHRRDLARAFPVGPVRVTAQRI